MDDAVAKIDDARRILAFREFTLDLDRAELRKAGDCVRLRPKAFDVLRYLVENQGRLVSKDELLKAVWAGSIVTEGSITQCLIDVRRALGDRSQSLVRTVPRRGYIFEAPVSRVADNASRDGDDRGATTDLGHRAVRIARRWAVIAAGLAFVVVAAWSVSLRTTKALEIDARIAARDSSAGTAYEQARFFYARRAPGDIDRAIRLYEEALRLDPRFARAWVGLAAAYRIQVTDGAIANDVGASKRRFAVQNALRIDRRSAPAHIEAARLAWDNGDETDATEHVREAIASSPEDRAVLTYLANSAAWSGRLDDAIELARRIVALDPLAAIAHNHLGNLLLSAGRWEEAKAEFARQFELNPSAEAETSLATAFILILEHRFDEAFALIERSPAGDDKNEILAMIGREGEADAALRALSSQAGLAHAVRVAEVHAFRGELEQAFHALERAHAGATRDSSSSPDSVWAWQINFSPFLRPLRDDARWAQLRSATGKPPPAIR